MFEGLTLKSCLWTKNLWNWKKHKFIILFILLLCSKVIFSNYLFPQKSNDEMWKSSITNSTFWYKKQLSLPLCTAMYWPKIMTGFICLTVTTMSVSKAWYSLFICEREISKNTSWIIRTIDMNIATADYFESVPQSLSCCHKYSLYTWAPKLWLKIDPNKHSGLRNAC